MSEKLTEFQKEVLDKLDTIINLLSKQDCLDSLDMYSDNLGSNKQKPFGKITGYNDPFIYSNSSKELNYGVHGDTPEYMKAAYEHYDDVTITSTNNKGSKHDKN